MKERPVISEFSQLKERLALTSQESNTYAKLAHFIADNYINIIFMTAGEVADAVGVSQGSVSRFCSALGYKGYNEFLSHLQGFVSAELTAPQRLQYTSKRSSSKNPDLLAMEHKNLDGLHAIMAGAPYSELVEQLATADEVILVSARMSATLLPYMYYILNKIRPGVTMVTPETSQWDTLALRDPAKTQIFTIAFPRYPNILLRKLEELKSAGFAVSAVTDSIISPVRALSDLIIEVPITRFSIFDIYSTPLLFLNLLLRDVSKKLPGAQDRLEHIERSEHSNQIYYRSSKS